MSDDPKKTAQLSCEFCHDNKGQPEEVYLHARCHLTAPLQASYKDGVLTLRCYIPECARIVAQFRGELMS